MRVFLCALLVSAFSAGAVFAGSPALASIEGRYVEARSADVYTGPCFANGEAGIVGKRAVLGWKIEKGSWQGVPLDGLAVAAVVLASDTLGYVLGDPYPVESVLIVDERADAAQRAALRAFARRMAGDLLDNIVRTEFAPIRLEIGGGSVHAARAKLLAGELARIETRALKEGDHICTNEEVWYRPLSRVDHAMPAYTLAHSFQGAGLGTQWSLPGQRSAFVGSFHYQD